MSSWKSKQPKRGGTVEVKIYDSTEREKLYPVDDIVEYARDCLGETDYNLIFENCEHFANECTIGEHRSKQVETVGNVLNILGGKSRGLFSTIARFAANLLGNIFSGSSSSGRRPSKTEKVKLAEVERDKQVKLADIEANTKLSLAEKDNARTKIEYESQVAVIEAQARVRMNEAEQQAQLRAIDNEFKLRLADKENERVELMRDAQIDIIKAQALSQVMIERARVEGMNKLAENLVAFQEKLIDLSNRRTLDSFNRSREEMSLQLDEVAQVVAKGYLKAGIMGELPSGNEPGKLQGNSLDTKLLSEPVAR